MIDVFDGYPYKVTKSRFGNNLPIAIAEQWNADDADAPQRGFSRIMHSHLNFLTNHHPFTPIHQVLAGRKRNFSFISTQQTPQNFHC